MNFARRLRFAAEYAGFRFVGAIFGALPVETASRLSGLGWRLLAPLSPRHGRALANLAMAFPDMPTGERQQIVLGMWDNLGRNFAEFFHLSRIIASDRIVLEEPERFEALRHAGGCVVCGLHLGNWELSAVGGARAGLRVAGVYQKIANPLVDAYVTAQRAPLYPAGLMDKSASAARRLLAVGRRGECVAFLADLREGRGVRSPFFGRAAPSTHFPAFIARNVDIPLFVVRVRRAPGVRFSLRLSPIVVERTDDRDADVRAATDAVQAAFEGFIRLYPEQWMWAHRRWD